MKMLKRWVDRLEYWVIAALALVTIFGPWSARTRLHLVIIGIALAAFVLGRHWPHDDPRS
jgi:CHASE2 domain-containing sensor protein